MSQEGKTWGMILHLSMLAGHVAVLVGFVAPIVIWQVKKDQLPEIDQHGKNAVNWLLSYLIYAAVCVPLCFVVIGFFLLALLSLASVIFCIIAGVKASNGEYWKYPGSIAFFR